MKRHFAKYRSMIQLSVCECVTNCVVEFLFSCFLRWLVFCMGKKGKRTPANRLYIYFILITSPNIPATISLKLSLSLSLDFPSHKTYTLLRVMWLLFTLAVKMSGGMCLIAWRFVRCLPYFQQNINIAWKLVCIRSSMDSSHHFMIINSSV